MKPLRCWFSFPHVTIECQKHNDYQESIKWLLSYAEECAGHGKMTAGHGKDNHAALTSVSFASMFHYPKFLLISSLSCRMVV